MHGRAWAQALEVAACELLDEVHAGRFDCDAGDDVARSIVNALHVGAVSSMVPSRFRRRGA